MSKTLCSVLLALSSLVCGSPAAELYVSPTGSDRNSGDRTAPLQTLGAARDVARKAGATNLTVHVADGVYYLPETLTLGSADSGIRFEAEHEGGAVISGGMQLDLQWAPYRDGILKSKTPPALAMDRLFVNGSLQRMARYPNYEAGVRPYGGYAADAFSKERAARWSDPAGGYIHAMHSAHWGGYHYRITGKNPAGEVTYEGGWQNNRQMGMHRSERFVENVFEELDAPGEWFHDAKAGLLYFCPPPAMNMATSTVVVARLRHLVEMKAAKGVVLKGFVFRHTVRTFMETREPLLRSDWTVYRGGAVLFSDCDDCSVLDCEFDQPGGNAVFVSGRNRHIRVAGCDIHDAGASAVAFVGDPKSVRNALFEYQQRLNYADLDRTPGPKTDDYPADCVVEDCLIRRVGAVEKQATGIQISMSSGITVRHCSIYEASRAGINISEGTFGGHVIEFCDVFDTVQETGDHGSFNSWGRDRFWGLKGAPAEDLPNLALLDAVRPSVIRNSRWRCDHGWDVDLDDGSSNYEIYNNLFLNGGLKLREGFHRKVWNNVAVNNSLHPHCWFDNCGDIVTNNIWMGAYRPAGGMPRGKWGAEVDRNLFSTSEADRTRFAANGCDAHSVVGDPMFVNPEACDYRVKEGSPALKLGFRNFPMDQFGVAKPSLRAMAREPALPGARGSAPETRAPAAGAWYWLGARLHGLEGEEFSAFGVAREEGGVQLVDVPAASAAATAGLRKDDLVQSINGHAVKDVPGLLAAVAAAGDTPLQVRVVRGQRGQTVAMGDSPFVRVETAGDAAGFKALPVPAVPSGNVTASRQTANDPLPHLVDGKLAAGYGPVFPNGVSDGAYKLDLGTIRPVTAVTSWSFNQNGNRLRQLVTLYGSSSGKDPGWKLQDRTVFTPLGTLDSGAAVGAGFAAASLRARAGKLLGSFRWIVWSVSPVTAQEESTAFQELAVEAAR